MVSKVQKTRSKNDFERDEVLASETLSEGKGRHVGARRNVASEAFDSEPEDYNEEDQAQMGVNAKDKVKTGEYEDDYGVAGRGMRGPDATPEPVDAQASILKRRVGTKDEDHDFPTGKWQSQKLNAEIGESTAAASVREGARSSKRMGTGARSKVGQGKAAGQRTQRRIGEGGARRRSSSTRSGAARRRGDRSL